MPILTLALKTISFAVYAVDLPYFDDWRSIAAGTIGTFALNDLFQPDNDTMYPVGKALDGLFVHLLNGNVVVYKLVTLLVILGSLILLQAHLLRYVTENPFILSASFISLIFMLREGTYWGKQFIAYHQAIPCVCILAIICLALKKPSLYRSVSLAVLSILAGFSYISGAFACVALGFALILQSRLVNEPLRAGAAQAGAIVSASALVPLSAQIWVIAVAQGGRTHHPDAPWALPSDVDFWFFVLGKFGRAFALPAHYPGLSLAATALVLAATFVASIYLFWPFWRRPGVTAPPEPHIERLLLILSSLAAAVGIYILMVAAGRANLRDPTIYSPLAIFAVGYKRFHFFWLTLLVPWIIATVMIAVDKATGRAWLCRYISLGIIVVLVTLALYSGTFTQGDYYSKQSRRRINDIHCISESLLAGRGTIACPAAYPGDLLPAYAHAASASLSFIRYLPQPASLPFIPIGENVLFRLTEANSLENVVIINALAQPDVRGLSIVAAHDPRIIVELAPAVRSCRALQVTITAVLTVPSELSLYYKPRGKRSFSIQNSAKARIIETGKPERRSFVVAYNDGFSPTIRFDPGRDAQHINLRNLEVGCLVPK